MSKHVSKTPGPGTPGRFDKSNKTAKSAAAHALTQANPKAGKFSAGVKEVSRRDRKGLIKLADR